MRVMCIHYTPDSQFLMAFGTKCICHHNACSKRSTPVLGRPFDILSDVFAFENLFGGVLHL